MKIIFIIIAISSVVFPSLSYARIANPNKAGTVTAKDMCTSDIRTEVVNRREFFSGIGSQETDCGLTSDGRGICNLFFANASDLQLAMTEPRPEMLVKFLNAMVFLGPVDKWYNQQLSDNDIIANLYQIDMNRVANGRSPQEAVKAIAHITNGKVVKGRVVNWN
jgi:hypothetical protein